MKRSMVSPKMRRQMSPKKYDIDFTKDVVYDIGGGAKAGLLYTMKSKS